MRLSSPVPIRRRRSAQMSTAASSTRPTRWPVLALIETIGAKSRNGTSLRIHSTYWSKVRSVFSVRRSHLLTAMTRPLPSSTT